MSSRNTTSKRRAWLWGGAIMITGMVVAFLYQLFGPNPKIIVSKETTVITSPLREDGLPDYQKYWRDLGRGGVTHENNAAVLFWQAIWPGELKGEDRLLVSEALDFEQVPRPTNTLQDPNEKAERKIVGLWLTERYQAGLSGEDFDALSSLVNQGIILSQADEVIGLAMTLPWTSEQVPPLADWVRRNERALDLLVEASKRPKWWSPSPSLLGNRYEGAVSIELQAAQSLRDVAWALCLRAMWHAGEGRRDESWTDLRTCFQLARFSSRGITLIEQLVAIAIDGIALQRTVALLQQDGLNTEFAQQVLDDLTALEMPCDLVKAVDEGDRLIFADSILRLADGHEIGGEESLGLIAILGIDWNAVLRDGNERHDRMTEIVQLSSRSERQSAIGEYELDIENLSKWASSPMARKGAFWSRSKRSSVVSAIMISLMMPDLSSIFDRQNQGETTLDLTRVAAALAVYRAEHGEYPEKFEQLVPAVVAQVPDDLYSGKPFIYKRMPEGGYLLYSVFENGKDDGGTDYNGEIVQGEWVKEESDDFDYENSDLVIRVPMPKFELPEMPELVE